MRTSLIEIKHIEDHLLKQLSPEEEVVFQANLLINKELTSNLEAQVQGYELIKSYGRKQLRLEIEAVQQKLFSAKEHKSFRDKILSIFR